ncbi:MAG: serine/threonine-protein kinase, partial [Myxococcota bacterium]|nr:serine/threonine-protein kinase [Myxococcota bacterium]
MRICPECDTRTEAERCPKDGRQTVDESRLKVRSVDPNIGLVIEGKYELVERLGRGGMGSVYRAVHKETGGHVAIKIMRADMVEEEGAIKRFYIEAQNTHKLHHPNTVRVSDFGQTDDGVLFLVMEYVQGQSLQKVLKTEGRMAPARAVHVISQILKSLGEAHQHGVVHRDIKPDNVMLIDQFGEPDFVKVLDFGISRTLEGTGASTKGAIGTPKYMAPEQWRGERIDARADLYSCGCVLYRMLTGRLPFQVESRGNQQVVAYMNAHLNEVASPLSSIIPGVVPTELEAMVMSLLTKHPDDRPADAQAALARLRWIEKHCELSEEVVTLEGPSAVTQPVAASTVTLPTPTGVIARERGEGAERSPTSVPSDSATGFPGAGFPTAPAPAAPTSPATLALAILAASAMIGGGGAAWFLLGDAPTPTTTVDEPPAVAVDLSTDQVDLAEPPSQATTTVATPTARAKRLLVITSRPTGATVRAADGTPIGATPLTLSRRAEITHDTAQPLTIPGSATTDVLQDEATRLHNLEAGQRLSFLVNGASLPL